ncbi:troponin C-like [Watersipora subatra]|uniref:troponin C-like n=1 Tax=Watersipora subatra TaxID=2589382 RepID=UPI00355BC2E2
MGEDDKPKLTKQQEDDAKGAFSLFDKKDTGVLPIKDLGQVFRSCAMTVDSEQLSDWLGEMGVEDQCDKETFVKLYALQKKKDEDEKEIKEAFRVLDKEKSGEIPVAELKWILKRLGDEMTDEEIDDIIVAIDTDGSGTVDYSEFAKVMNG